MVRVGILTSGGDCQGLNAAMRAVAKTLYCHYGENKIEIYGIKNGYKGLIYGDYQLMKPCNFSGILNRGGTILGTSRQPFKSIRESDEHGLNRVNGMKRTYTSLRLDCLVVLGGNGSLKTANLLSEEGMNVIMLPKTIDNDLWGSDLTFGFQSAVNVATDVIDGIHTTATSHGRVFIVELMGHKVGWLTLYAGISAGADIILIPEIPYSVKKIVSDLKKRERSGKNFSIIAMAEGAFEKSTSSDKKIVTNGLFRPSMSYMLADELATILKQEVRVVIPGHYQRGGNPSAPDRMLATRLGVAVAKSIIKEEYGKLAVLKSNKIQFVKLADAAGKLKKVPVNSDLIKTARALGISFGD